MKVNLRGVINIAKAWDDSSPEHFSHVYDLIVEQLDLIRENCEDYNRRHSTEIKKYNEWMKKEIKEE